MPSQEPSNSAMALSWLVNLSNDLERCRLDHQFVEAGGEIIYVFDSKLFRMFIRPSNFKEHFSSLRYSDGTQTATENSQLEKLDSSISLLTSEYLFSTELLGSRNSVRYVSPWHGEELNNSIMEMFTKQVEQVDLFRDEANDQIQQKLGLLQTFKESDQFPEVSDSQANFPTTQFSHKDSSHFILAKSAAELLAEDNITEPLDQLFRLLSPPIRDRIKRLEDRFAFDNSAREEIIKSARRWSHELRQRDKTLTSASFNPEQKRKLNQHWFDALTISQVEWIARNSLRNDERIVFVTENPILFDVYRSAYTKDLYKDYKFNEFVCRPVRQYAPIFYTALSNSGLIEEQYRSNSQLLMRQISDTLESLLLPLNYQRLKNSETDDVFDRLRAREYMSLRASHKGDEFFDSVFEWFVKDKASWKSRIHSNMQSMAKDWTKLEHLSIGAYLQLLINRLNDDNILFGDGSNIEFDESYVLQIQTQLLNAIDSIKVKNFEAARPFTEQFVQQYFLQNRTPSRRIPRTLWSRDAHNTYFYEVLENQAEHENSETFSSILSKSHSMFAFAAMMALRDENWSLAEEFSEHAMSALMQDNSKANESEFHEYQFLKAVTLRFSLGALFAHLQFDIGSGRKSVAANSFLEASSRYYTAREILEGLVSQFKATDGERERLLAIRACSELAALHLFMGYLLLCTQPNAITGRASGIRISRLMNEVERLHAFCFQNERDWEDDVIGELNKRNRSQYLYNSSACHVIRHLSGNVYDQGKEFIPDRYIQYLVNPKFDSEIPEMTMTQLEVGLFRLIRNGFASSTELERLINDINLDLPLDNAVLGLIKLKIFSK